MAFNMDATIDSIISLRCENASLATELRIVKEQIDRATSGSVYMAELLGERRFNYTPAPMDDLASLRALNLALETEVRAVKDEIARAMARSAYLNSLDGEGSVSSNNSSSEIVILGSQQQQQQVFNSSNETVIVGSQQQQQQQDDSDTSSQISVLAVSLSHQPQNNQNLAQENAILRSKLKAALKCNERLQRRLDACRSEKLVLVEDGENDSVGSSELGDRATVHLFGAEYVHDGVDGVFKPGGIEGLTADQILDKLRVSKSVEQWVSTSFVPPPVEGSVGAEGVDLLALEDHQEENQETSTEGIRIECSNGETFYVHSPSPLPELDDTIEVSKRQTRLAARPLMSRFMDYEHARLAGSACFIEEKTEEQYNAFWADYEYLHREHSADEWREYYEAELRPGYLKSMARFKSEKGSGSDSGERKDSGFALLNSEVGSPGLGITGIEGLHRESDQPKAITSCEEMPLIDLTTVEESETHIGRNVGVAAMVPLVTTNEQGSSDRQHDNSELDADLLVASTNNTPLATTIKHIDASAPNTYPIPIRTRIQSLIECKAFARSVIKNCKRTAPDDHDHTQIIEMSETFTLAFRPFHRSDIMEVDMDIDMDALTHDVKHCKIDDPMDDARDDSDVDFLADTVRQVSLVEPVGISVPRPPGEPPKPVNLWPRPPQEQPSQRPVMTAIVEGATNEPDSTDPRRFRTILIGNIPVGTTRIEVIDKVHGGALVSVQFAATAGMKTRPPMTTHSVLVEFYLAEDAQSYHQDCSRQPIFFNLPDGSQQQASVSLVNVPTSPVIPRTTKDKYGEWASRLVCMKKDRLDRAILLEKFPQFDVAIRSSEQNGLLTFEFACIDEAVRAWRAMNKKDKGLGVKVFGFGQDPCSEPRDSEMG